MLHSLTRTAIGAALLASGLTLYAQQPAPSQPASIVGAWTFNKDQSDQPPAPPQNGDNEGRGRARGGGGGGGFGGGGGRGGGGFGRRGGGGGGRGDFGGNREEMERRREAMRDVLQPADRLTITRTDTMVIVTAGDGRTTRLSTDGKKVKDDSTGIERKTHWDGDRLVSEISGVGRSKLTETYSIDPQTHQLIVVLDVEGAPAATNGRDSNGSQRGPGLPRVPRRRVYDPS